MSRFEIFGDHHNRQIVKNFTRQPLSNIENMGKTISSGPYKPNEPMKKGGETKKSFLSNTGKALQQNTPGRKVFTPRAVNVTSMIYSDENEGYNMEEIEFTKPLNRNTYYKEFIDMMLPEPALQHELCPPTPPPMKKEYSLEYIPSYDDDFFKDFSDDDIDFQNLNHSNDDLMTLPNLW